MTQKLRLDATKYRSDAHWRWVLRDAAGQVLAEHDVALDQDANQYRAFTDLYRYLQWRVPPDRRLTDEASWVEWIGRWMGTEVLGQVGATMAAVAAASPVTVEVHVPRNAHALLSRPLELAYVDDRPLALHDVSLVFQTAGLVAGKRDVADRLRMLAVFSVPTDLNALALRRERRELVELMRAIADRTSAAIQLMTLQYGWSRHQLRDLLRVDEGWDIVHFSGHGLAGGLVLTDDEGERDVIGGSELVALLAGTRSQVKLVTLSSCESAGLAVAESLQLIGLPGPAADEAVGRDMDDTETVPLPALATELAERLDCAVLAMRYPVGDEFARLLTCQLYGRLLEMGIPLPGALQLALADAAAPPPTPGRPALSVGTPALFGRRAADLRLMPPTGESIGLGPTGKLAGFPEEPGRFVGRIGALHRAVQALAPAGAQTGVVFFGMAGAGKTACALELAHTLEDAFDALVWFQAPEEDLFTLGALGALSHALEVKLPGLRLLHLLDDGDDLDEAVSRLRTALQRQRVLVVLDNLESLLDEDGAWRDPRWAAIAGILAGHEGPSRVVLTARRRPKGLDPRVEVVPVHALRFDESLLLARELPGLRALLDGETYLDLEAGRELVARTLEIVQGHPMLLHLADRLAADPDRLERHLAEADRMWASGGVRLSAFLRDGEAVGSPQDFLDILEGWTNGIAATLPQRTTMLFWLLCTMEEEDRSELVVRAAWRPLQKRIEQPQLPSGVEGMKATLTWRLEDLPAIDDMIQMLVDTGLIMIETPPNDVPTYMIHPAVATAGRAAAGEEFRALADGVLADLWFAQFAAELFSPAGEATRRMVRICVSAAPYLLRAGRWRLASTVIEQALVRDHSRETAATLSPLVHQLEEVAEKGEPELAESTLLMQVLGNLSSDGGEERYAQALAEAVAQGRYRAVAVLVSGRAEQELAAGRPEEALRLFDQQRDYLRRSSARPWRFLAVDVGELRAWQLQGHDEEILDRVLELRQGLADLPEEWEEQEEYVIPWRLHEDMLWLGRWAAISLRRMQEALVLGQDLIQSMERRFAPPLEIARAKLMQYAPLRGLGRPEEARRILLECQEVFADAEYLDGIGGVYSALAVIEVGLGHAAEALRLGEDALRMHYRGNDFNAIAEDHHNFAALLRSTDGSDADQIAHRLAACMIRLLTGEGQFQVSLTELARDLGATDDDPPIPSSFAALVERVNQVEGVRFERLFERIRDARTGDAVVAEVVRRAVAMSSEELLGLEHHVTTWEWLLVGLAMAAEGDRLAAGAVARILHEDHHHSEWAALIATFGRMLAGERGEQLLSGLDVIDATIVRRALEAIAGRFEFSPTAVRAWAAQMLVYEAIEIIPLVAAAQKGDRRADELLERIHRHWQRQGGDRATVATALRRASRGTPATDVLAGVDPSMRRVVSVLLTALEWDRR